MQIKCASAAFLVGSKPTNYFWIFFEEMSSGVLSRIRGENVFDMDLGIWNSKCFFIGDLLESKTHLNH